MNNNSLIDFIENTSNQDFINNIGFIDVSYRNINSIKTILDKGGKINETDRKGNTPLHLAIKKNLEKVPEFLVRNNANINAKNVDGNTPLLIASSSSISTRIFKFLIENGADVNIRNNYNVSPLEITIKEFDLKKFNLLIANGAASNNNISNTVNIAENELKEERKYNRNNKEIEVLEKMIDTLKNKAAGTIQKKVRAIRNSRNIIQRYHDPDNPNGYLPYRLNKIKLGKDQEST
jgi:ankyrin repeat protein